MDAINTDQNFPLSGKWIFRKIFFMIMKLILVGLVFPVLLVGAETTEGTPITNRLMVIIFVFLIYFIVETLYTILKRKKLHFSIEDKFLMLNEGVLSKKQRNMPYSAIQNILVRKDFLGRLLDYSTLIIENASGGKDDSFPEGKRKRGRIEIIGSCGNKIYIPGLKTKDAERLKNLLLQKIQENPEKQTGSGL